MKSENLYAEAIDPDTVEIRIKGHRFQVSSQEASMYGAHIANAERQCRMMVDRGCVPERIAYAATPTEPKIIALEWAKEVKTHRDGEGKRFWVPALYLASGDGNSALAYCEAFIIDCKKRDLNFNEPSFLLSFLIASFEQNSEIATGGFNECILHELHIANPYLLDLAVGNKVEPLDGRIHFTNKTSFGWARNLPSWLYTLVSSDLKKEIKRYQKSITYRSFVSTQADLNKNCITRDDNEYAELHTFESRHQLL